MAHKLKQFIRKLTKSGEYTYYVVIPKEIIDELHWKEHQKLVVRKYGKGILIKDWQKAKAK